MVPLLAIMTVNSKPYRQLLLLLLSFILFFPQKSTSQTIADTALQHQSLEKVNGSYKKGIGENLHLYSGNEYVAPAAFGQKVSGFFPPLVDFTR